MIDSMKNPNIQYYLQNKNSKYKLQNKICLISKNHLPSYFKEWLAGFIETKGSFHIWKMDKNYSFHISHYHDKYIINAIQSFYNTNIQVQHNKQKEYSDNIHYQISFSSINDILKVVQHCKPLLQGHQFLSLINFLQNNPKLTFMIKLLKLLKLKSVMLSCYYES